MAPRSLIRHPAHLSVVPGGDEIRVLIVEEHALVRAGLRALLEAEPGIAVAAEASDLDQASRLAPGARPDVVVIHARHGGPDSQEAIARVASHGELDNASVLILTTRDSDDYVLAALRAGASGLLFKETGPEDLVGAIRVLAGGQAVLAPRGGQRTLTLVASSEAVKEI
jgi:DNA-binding NarL/FixJ family response regulator